MTNNVCLTGLGLSTGELVYINPDNTVSYAPKDEILTADYLEWKFVNNNGNNGLLQSTKTDHSTNTTDFFSKESSTEPLESPETSFSMQAIARLAQNPNETFFVPNEMQNDSQPEKCQLIPKTIEAESLVFSEKPSVNSTMHFSFASQQYLQKYQLFEKL